MSVLQLEFERGRVPAKGRAFFNDKKGTFYFVYAFVLNCIGL